MGSVSSFCCGGWYVFVFYRGRSGGTAISKGFVIFFGVSLVLICI